MDTMSLQPMDTSRPKRCDQNSEMLSDTTPETYRRTSKMH